MKKKNLPQGLYVVLLLVDFSLAPFDQKHRRHWRRDILAADHDAVAGLSGSGNLWSAVWTALVPSFGRSGFISSFHISFLQRIGLDLQCDIWSGCRSRQWSGPHILSQAIILGLQ